MDRCLIVWQRFGSGWSLRFWVNLSPPRLSVRMSENQFIFLGSTPAGTKRRGRNQQEPRGGGGTRNTYHDGCGFNISDQAVTCEVMTHEEVLLKEQAHCCLESFWLWQSQCGAFKLKSLQEKIADSSCAAVSLSTPRDSWECVLIGKSKRQELFSFVKIRWRAKRDCLWLIPEEEASQSSFVGLLILMVFLFVESRKFVSWYCMLEEVTIFWSFKDVIWEDLLDLMCLKRITLALGDTHAY